MGVIFLIVLGAALGWLATVVLPARHNQQLVVNLTAGIGGALAAGLLINPILGGGNLIAGTYRVEGLFIAFIGSSLALLSANLLHRSEMR